jgi:Fe-S cluster biogenesis protein NfuA
MFIQTETTPNPDTIKFLPGQPVSPGGRMEFKEASEADGKSPLAARLFRIPEVKSVFFGSDFVSVTRREDADWNLLKSRVMAEIMQHYLSGLPAIEEKAAQAAGPKPAPQDEDVISSQIRELLETRVQPAVAQDGGHIEFVKFEDGVAYLHMQGACAGCPSSAITLKSGIENLLKHYVPEVVSVEQIEL